MNIAIVTHKNVVSNYVNVNRMLSAFDYKGVDVKAKVYDFEERNIPERNILYVDVIYQGGLSALSRFLPEKNIVFYAYCDGFPMIDPACMEREVAAQMRIVPFSRFIKMCLETVGLNVEEPVYPGIDMEQTATDPSFSKWIKAHMKGPIILCVSGNSERKGLDRFMVACKIVYERLRSIEPSFILHSSEGYVKIPTIMRDLELKNFWYTGNFGMFDETKMNSFYSLCSVYVQPSLCEGFGLPMIEAYRFLKPVVAIDVEPYKEIVEDKKTGRLIPVKGVEQMRYLDRFVFPMHIYSVEDMADAIESLLLDMDVDPHDVQDRPENYSEKAIEETRKRFTLRNYSKLLEYF